MKKFKLKAIASYIMILTMLIGINCSTIRAAETELPSATDVWFWGITISGRTLTGKYTFSEDSANDKSTYRWLRSESKKGTYSPIEGATSITYTMTAADVDMYIKFEVTPETETAIGTPVSTDGYPVSAESIPEIKDVSLNGSGKSREQLWVDYHYYDKNDEPMRNVYFQWQAAVDDETYRDIEGADAQAFIPDDEYCGMYIRCKIQADKLGNTDTIPTGECPISEAVYTESIVIKAKPTIKNVSIIASDYGYKAEYVYSSPKDDDEGTHEYLWEVSQAADGEYYTVSKECRINIYDMQQDYYLRLGIRPVSKDGVSGDISYSTPLKVTARAEAEKDTKILSAATLKDGYILIKTTSPAFIEGIVITLNTSDSNIEIKSHDFNVTAVYQDGQYTASLIAKEGCAVYSSGAVMAIYTNDENVSIGNISATGVNARSELFEFSNEEDIGELTITETEDNTLIYSRRIRHYSSNQDKYVFIYAEYSDKALRDCKMDRAVLFGFSQDILEATPDKQNNYDIKLFLLNPETLKPYTAMEEGVKK